MLLKQLKVCSGDIILYPFIFPCCNFTSCPSCCTFPYISYTIFLYFHNYLFFYILFTFVFINFHKFRPDKLTHFYYYKCIKAVFFFVLNSLKISIDLFVFSLVHILRALRREGGAGDKKSLAYINVQPVMELLLFTESQNPRL